MVNDMENNGKEDLTLKIEKLDQLKKLLDMGVLTEAEFEQKKKEVLGTEVKEKKTVYRYEIKEPEKKPKGKGAKAAVIALVVLALLAAAAYFIPSLGIRCMILGHDETGSWEITKEATCTEEGTEVRKCTVCGKTLETGTLSKKAHQFKDGVCTVCGEKDPGYTEPSKPEEAPLFSVVTTVELNVRSGPGTNFSVKRTLPYNTTVDVYESSGGSDQYYWYRIGSGEWVADDLPGGGYLRFVENKYPYSDSRYSGTEAEFIRICYEYARNNGLLDSNFDYSHQQYESFHIGYFWDVRQDSGRYRVSLAVWGGTSAAEHWSGFIRTEGGHYYLTPQTAYGQYGNEVMIK